ncbi:MAG: HAMP domain-containing histidine kinase [Actinobacteria bacterium]|nr:HAMP domain-containing histidine kinase [Actinomycetota bacterium]
MSARPGRGTTLDRDERDAWEATAAVVAHELGTPLAAAQAAVRLLAGTDDPDEREELGDAALRTLHLLDLQVRRLQQLGGNDPRPQLQADVDLAALARGVVEDLSRSTLGDHPSSVTAGPTVLAPVDPDQIRQILFNLLSNAAKFSPAGREIVVDVDARGDRAVVQVRDRGDGVAPDDAERIFERYERAAEGIPGAGIGLHLSRRIARAHGGDLYLVPAEEEGAVFELVLPLAAGGETGDRVEG